MTTITIPVTKDLRDDDIPALPDPRDHVYIEAGQTVLPPLVIDLRPGPRTVSVYVDDTDLDGWRRTVDELNEVRLVWRLRTWPTPDCLRTALLDIVRDHAPGICDGYDVDWTDSGDPVGVYDDMAQLDREWIDTLVQTATAPDAEAVWDGWEVVVPIEPWDVYHPDVPKQIAAQVLAAGVTGDTRDDLIAELVAEECGDGWDDTDFYAVWDVDAAVADLTEKVHEEICYLTDETD